MISPNDLFHVFTRQVNLLFVNKEPWQIAAITTTTILTTLWIVEQIQHDECKCFQLSFSIQKLTTSSLIICRPVKIANISEGITIRAKKIFFRLIRRVPPIRRRIETEIGKVSGEMEKWVEKRTANLDYFMTLPELGLSHADILRSVEAYLSLGDFEWKDGHVSGAVYNLNAELCDLVGTVYQKTSYTNPLHSDVFPGINKMEAEVVRMCAAMFNGGPESVGTV